MKRLILLSLILLVSCGQNADQAEAEKVILNHEKPEPISTRIKLNSEPHEIILLAFPDQTEVSDYSFVRSNSNLSDEEYNGLFNLVSYGDKYVFDITRDMTPAQKVQGIMGKVITLSDARDNAIRQSHEPKKLISSITKKIQDNLNQNFPCFEVYPDVNPKKHKNFKKCYLKPVVGITKKTPKFWKSESCKSTRASVDSYLKLATDENIPASATTEYFMDSNLAFDWIKDLDICDKNEELVERNKTLHGLGKIEVATLLGTAEEKIKDKLIFKAKSDLDDVNGAEEMEYTVIFNPETMEFEEFSIPIDFFDGSGPELYSPQLGNMTPIVVSEINGSGFFRVDSEIKAPLFTLKTLGLSLDLDPILGLRVSGKTMLYYHEGHTRAGILKIHVTPKE